MAGGVEILKVTEGVCQLEVETGETSELFPEMAAFPGWTPYPHLSHQLKPFLQQKYG